VATETGSIGVDHPEVNLARTLVKRRSLSPPINVEALVKERASLSYEIFPFSGVDGVCLNMKGGIEEARVIINRTSLTRQRFTLAHELGHLLIPWHVGSIIDTIDLSSLPATEAYTLSQEYYQLEEEANRFAAEVLMPHAWIIENIAQYSDLAELHRQVAKGADVSPIAAAIHLSRFLQPGMVWVIESDGEIQNQGMSFGTLVSRMWRGMPFSENMYPNALARYRWANGNNSIYWWELPVVLSIENKDSRTWQEVFTDIIDDINYEDPIHQKKSINGVIGSLNDKMLREAKKIGSHYSPEILVAALIQRFTDSEYEEFSSHKDFEIFVKKKAESIFNNPRKQKR
jgi:hypothetical protein